MSQQEGHHAAEERLKACEQKKGIAHAAQQLGQDEQLHAAGVCAAGSRQGGYRQERHQGRFHGAGDGQAMQLTIHIQPCCYQEKYGRDGPEGTICFHNMLDYSHKYKKSLVNCQKIRIFAVPSFVTEPGLVPVRFFRFKPGGVGEWLKPAVC